MAASLPLGSIRPYIRSLTDIVSPHLSPLCVPMTLLALNVTLTLSLNDTTFSSASRLTVYAVIILVKLATSRGAEEFFPNNFLILLPSQMAQLLAVTKGGDLVRISPGYCIKDSTLSSISFASCLFEPNIIVSQFGVVRDRVLITLFATKRFLLIGLSTGHYLIYIEAFIFILNFETRFCNQINGGSSASKATRSLYSEMRKAQSLDGP